MTVTKCQAEATDYWVSRKAVSRVSYSERLVSRYIDISRMIESSRIKIVVLNYILILLRNY